MEEQRGSETRWYLACAAVAALVLAAYANHFHNGFHFDDWHTVEQNLFIRDLKNVPRFFTDAQTFSALPSNQSYRPLVTTTLAIDYRIGGLDPFWFHVDNFFFFALTCALLLALFRRALGDRWLALFGAGLYALHAANAETVNYVISRSDIISTALVVASLYVYAALPRGREYYVHVILAALSVLAKEQGAMAALLLFLWIALVEQQLSLRQLLAPRRFWGALRPALPALVACGWMAVLTQVMATSFVPGGASRAQYFFTQPWAMLHYALMFLAPVGLSADTDWKAVQSWLDPQVLIGFAFVAAALWLAVRASSSPRTRPAALGLLWFFAALLPTSSVIPLAEVINDHRMYFPFVGLALAAACGAGLLRERLRATRVGPTLSMTAAALVLCGHALGVRARNQVWRSDESLWRDVTEKSPGNPRAWMNYGLTFMGKGKYDEAEKWFRRGLALAPYYGYLHTNLAIVESERGHSDVAESEFREGVRLMPEAPVLRFYYARWLDKMGRDAEAVPMLRQVLAMAPADSVARQLLLHVLAKMKAWGELAEAAQEALRIRDDDPTARAMLELARTAGPSSPADAATPDTPEALLDMSLRLYQAGRYAESAQAADRALQLRPAYAEAFNNKCAAFNQLHRYLEAAQACEAALRVRPDFQLARNNLAVARAAGH